MPLSYSKDPNDLQARPRNTAAPDLPFVDLSSPTNDATELICIGDDDDTNDGYGDMNELEALDAAMHGFQDVQHRPVGPVASRSLVADHGPVQTAQDELELEKV